MIRGVQYNRHGGYSAMPVFFHKPNVAMIHSEDMGFSTIALRGTPSPFATPDMRTPWPLVITLIYTGFRNGICRVASGSSYTFELRVYSK